MDGRALPMKSAMPRVISESVVSGEVNRPTLITGFFDQVLDKGNVGFLETLRTEPRGREIVHPVADIDVPKIGKVGKHFDDPAALIFPCYAVLADQFIGGEPQCDRHAATNGFQRIFKKFPQKPYAVFQAAPVFIRAAVATPGKKIPCLSGCHPHPLYVWCGDKWLGRRTKRGWMFCSGKTFRLGLTYLA